jgi:carboxypeptidase Taq
MSTYTSSTKKLYRQYKSHFRKIADVKYAIALLQWDQETYMPPKGAGFRAQQIASLSEIAHNLFTQETTANLLLELSSRDDLIPDEMKNIELSLYDYNRQRKLPAKFVRTLSETVSKSYESWLRARKQNSFQVFEKDLELLIELKKQEADLLGYEGHPYNALLNEYERGATVTMLDIIFEELQEPLLDLLAKIKSQPQVNDSFLLQQYSKKDQWELGLKMIRELGFDFRAGRQDISEHPFTTNFSSKDVRITTRIDEHNLSSMLWSCIHELGHALYEQGLPESEYGTPLGEFTSLGIHESQSRLWENNIGRSQNFWKKYFPVLTETFPQQLNGITLEDFYKGINKVQPSLIRTEADELTYHFHVLIRYQLEKKLMEGSLKTGEIPGYWNSQYLHYLGVNVPDHKSGCLQDVHWSHGSFGYFATYSLGSLYAAQFYHAAEKAVPTLENDITNGRIVALMDWLRAEIHCHGRRYTSEEICRKVSGEPLNIQYFMNYARKKYQHIYSLS